MSTKERQAETQELAISHEPGIQNGHSQVDHEPLHEPKEYHLTEFGNVERMLDRYGQDIRWNRAFGYIVWNGQRWLIEKDTYVERLAWQTIRSIYLDVRTLTEIAYHCPNEESRKVYAARAETLIKWARLSETRTMVASMLALARSHVMVETDKFDMRPYLFNFQNGTFDFTTGKLYPHRREDYLTLCSPFKYNPHAVSPIFDIFFHDIMLGNEPLKRYLQKVLGYSMTANNKEDAWFILIGNGENGKTTLFDAIQYVMGEYAVRIDEQTISISAGSSKSGSQASPDIARLKGKRLGIVAETEEGARAAISRLKDMASGETVTARYLHRDNFEFSYTHKLFVYTNHKLIIRDNSHGSWRRIHMIPFNYLVPPEKKDKKLIDKLRAEAEGILAWMIAGELLRQKEGLEPPAIVKRATQEYRESQDVLGQYVREFCITGKDEWVQAKAIQGSFKTWLEEEMSMKPISMPTFSRMMEDHGFTKQHTRHGKVYQGLRMKEEYELIAEHDHSNECDTSVTFLKSENSHEMALQADLSDERDLVTSSKGIFPLEDTIEGKYPYEESQGHASSLDGPVEPIEAITEGHEKVTGSHASHEQEPSQVQITTASQEDQHERQAAASHDEPMPLPHTSTNYPYDVYAWYKHAGLRMEKPRCNRNHENFVRLPWLNSRTGIWEDLCSLCYPALHTTNGKSCFFE